MNNKVQDILKTMSLEDKAKMVSGKDFWWLEAYEPAGLKSIMMTDGPHGLRKQKGSSDHLGLSDSLEATCFPTAAALASTWNLSLLETVGHTLGNECKSEQVSILLGPGANIKRHPLCGRNFEYFSEDPFLSGKMASAWIKGIQTTGIGASLKHFVANNQETNRMIVDAIIDERTLRELYLKSFEIAIKEARPWTVMCSYNKVNGTYLSEHTKLLGDVLKKEWSYKGVVVTDWGACNDRVKGLIAGQDLEMPSSGVVHTNKIIKAIKQNNLEKSVLNSRVESILDLIIKGNEELKEEFFIDQEQHHLLAREAASEAMVLLKNKDSILPLDFTKKVALIGEFAEYPRYQGAGSSRINPTKLVTAKEAFNSKFNDEILYARGYDISTNKVDETLVKEAVEIAKQADVVVLMVGLTDQYESEGFDREHLNLPQGHTTLIDAITTVNSNIIIVLSNGAPVAMPWKENVKAILEQYLGGQASGQALVDVIFGIVNPSGKLAETFPNHLDEFPANQHFSKTSRQEQYEEGLYVGYRAYDTLDIEPLYPFGYGLSYTTFEYSNLQISQSDTQIKVTCDVTNTGDMDGKEVVQIYIHKEDSIVYRPNQELKGFEKIFLKKGETKSITIDILLSYFSVFNKGSFKIEPGNYQIRIAASSRDIRLQQTIIIESDDKVIKDNLLYYKKPKANFKPSTEDFKALLGHDIPPILPIKPFHINSTIGEMSHTFVGKQLKKMITKHLKAVMDDNNDETTTRMINRTIDEMPIRNLVTFSNGDLSEKQTRGLIALANKRPLRGLWKLITG